MSVAAIPPRHTRSPVWPFFQPLYFTIADPETILKSPAVDVIKRVLPVWDETIVLPDSEIGGLADYARRKGNTWFLAIRNAKTRNGPMSLFMKGEKKSGVVSRQS